MSSSGLTSSAQLQYLLQWFGEFSELQREDFLPVLAAASQGKEEQLAGILAGLHCEGKPVSLFQCRIKLFNEWFPNWAEEEQHRLIKGITEMDAEFGRKLQELITDGPKLNGDSNGLNGFHTSEYTDEEVNTTERNVVENDDENTEENAVDDNVVSENNIPLEIAAAS